MKNQLQDGYERNCISTNYEDELRSIILLEPNKQNNRERVRETKERERLLKKNGGKFIDFSFSSNMEYF